MKISKETEAKIREIANKYMEQARPGWGAAHANASVFHVKELINKEGGNSKILIPVMYLHDIGYAGLLKKDYTHADNHSAKKQHMVKGAEMSKKILNEIGEFSDTEINKISNLIGIHDALDKIDTPEMQIVFEADSLGQIDANRVHFNYAGEDFVKWINRFKKRRASRFKTKTGLKRLNKLLPLAEHYYDKQK